MRIDPDAQFAAVVMFPSVVFVLMIALVVSLETCTQQPDNCPVFTERGVGQ